MLFRDYVELLYRAYLEDQGILQSLRDKVQDLDYLKDLEEDPALQDWEQVDPRSIDPRRWQRSRFHPNPVDPQQGVRVFEGDDHDGDLSRRRVDLIRQVVRRKQENRRGNSDSYSRQRT
jgi:hypothetical protein